MSNDLGADTDCASSHGAVQREQLLQQRLRQLYSRTIEALVPICIRAPRGEPELVGTGIALRIDDHIAIATAAHVADHGANTKLYVRIGETLCTLPAPYSTSLPASGKREDDATDLAFWILQEPYRKKLGEMRPLNALQSDIWNKAPRTLEDGSDYVVVGYPRSQQSRHPKPSSRGYELEFRPQIFLLRPYSAEARAEANLKFSDTLLLDYDKENSYTSTGRRTGPDLYGVSGSPVWYAPNISEEKCGVPKLAGIAIEWRKKHPVGIIATPMVHLLRGVIAAIENKL